MEWVFIVANVAIVCGYMFLAARVAPNVRIKYWWTKAGGVFFFMLCAFTHAGMAYWATLGLEHHINFFWTAIHVLQAVAVWVFVWGLFRELVMEKLPIGPTDD